MNSIYRVTSFALFLAAGLCLYGQASWTLEDCIIYAREQNIQVQKSKLAEETAEVNIKEAKAALFPSLSGSVSQSFRNSQVRNDNGDYRYESNFGGDYNLSAGLTVFNGKRNLYNIKQAELAKEVQELNTAEIQNNIEVAITKAYLQILYMQESIRNFENILETSAAQVAQSQIFLDAGTITRSELAQVEAQYSSDKYNLIAAQNNYENYILQLKQLLELEYDNDFMVAIPEIDEEDVIKLIPSTSDVYRTALTFRPEVENSKLQLDIANLNKSIARAGYLPTISVSGSIGTSNTYNHSPSFATQFGRNFAQSVGVTVSVPIFDNRQNKSNVQRAEINILTAKLDMIDTEKDLLSTIQNLHLDAVSSQSQYFAAKDRLTSAMLSFELVQEQYELGMRNTVELTTEKNNYANAVQELLQGKIYGIT